MNFLKNTNAQVLLFFLQSSRCFSNEHSCLKTSGLYDDLFLVSSLLHFFISVFFGLFLLTNICLMPIILAQCQILRL